MKLPSVLFLCLLSASAQAATLKPVKIYFLEGLAPRDSTSSERFQRDYDAAIETGKRLTATRLAQCGYQLETKTSFYDASDPVQAKEKAQQAIQEGAWLLVGPRRSNHYLLLAQGAGSTPSVSIMATASEIDKLGPLHLSLSASNPSMAKVAAAEARSRLGKNRTYVTVVSSECLACKDFAQTFDVHAKRLGLTKREEIQVIGESPDTTELVEKIRKLSPGFVLLPNYSKLSSYLVAAIRAATQTPFFVGSDGWGDSNFGFVQNNPQVASATGFSVRGLPPIEIGLKAFPVGQELLRQPKQPATPYSGPALAILKTIDSTADLLCKTKPKTTEAFRAVFEKSGRKLYSSPWGVSIYSLEGEKLTFKSVHEVR
jgi:hypothetical protein